MAATVSSWEYVEAIVDMSIDVLDRRVFSEVHGLETVLVED